MKLLLNYAVVGMTEVFGVEIDDGLPLWKLIEAIAKAMGYNEKVSNLQLFLAKKDGAWLNGAGAASVALEEDGTPRGFGKKMDPSLYIKNPRNFGVDFQPGEGVHVLVVVPQQEGQSVELPNVIWYGSRGSTGQGDSVNLEDERTLSRNTLTNDVINRLDKNHVLFRKIFKWVLFRPGLDFGSRFQYKSRDDFSRLSTIDLTGWATSDKVTYEEH